MSLWSYVRPREPAQFFRRRLHRQGARFRTEAVREALRGGRGEKGRQLLRCRIHQAALLHFPAGLQKGAEGAVGKERTGPDLEAHLFQPAKQPGISNRIHARVQIAGHADYGERSRPARARKPNRPLLYALVSLGSLALGLLLGLILELRRNVFLGEWELPEGATVLARLPYIEVPMQASGSAPRPRGKGMVRKKELAVASCVGLLSLPGVLAGARSLFDRF